MDRLETLEIDIRESDKAVLALSTNMAALRAEVSTAVTAISELTKVQREHAKTLSEYMGARKIIHWLTVIAGSVFGYFFGRGTHS